MKSVAELQAHARALAQAFGVQLIEDPQFKPDEAFALAGRRVAVCHPIIDETTYAVALHEMGHVVAPTGSIRHLTTGNEGNLKREEERAAWAWARHYAIDWSPAMDAVAQWAEGTYAKPTVKVTKQIDWNQWK